MDESPVHRRLWGNLDTLDKTIARTAIALFSLSLLYIIYYYGVTTEITVPVVGKLQKAFPYYLGAPVILFLFHYFVISGYAMTRVESELRDELRWQQRHGRLAGDLTSDENDSPLPLRPQYRVPTYFSESFVLEAFAETTLGRRLSLFHFYFVILTVFVLPLTACVLIIKGLLKYKVSGPILWAAIISTIGCLAEACIVYVAARKTRAAARQARKEADEAKAMRLTGNAPRASSRQIPFSLGLFAFCLAWVLIRNREKARYRQPRDECAP